MNMKDRIIPIGKDRLYIPGKPETPLNPHEVSIQTLSILNLYLAGKLSIVAPGIEYLKQTTIGYIQQAKDGLADYVQRRLSKRYALNTPPRTEVRESMDHCAVVLSLMPIVTHDPKFPSDYLRGRILRPPSSTSEFGFRLIELENIIDGVVDGTVDLQGEEQPLLPIYRTHKFFKTGAELSLHVPQSAEELADIADIFVRGLPINTVTSNSTSTSDDQPMSLENLLGNSSK